MMNYKNSEEKEILRGKKSFTSTTKNDSQTIRMQKHHRQSVRLPDFDYSQTGAYFLTICTHQRKCLFGEIVNGKIMLNEYGKISDVCWNGIPTHFPHAQLDEYVIMPNHVHGIIIVGTGILATGYSGARHAFGHGMPSGTACRAPTSTKNLGNPLLERFQLLRGHSNPLLPNKLTKPVIRPMFPFGSVIITNMLSVMKMIYPIFVNIYKTIHFNGQLITIILRE